MSINDATNVAAAAAASSASSVKKVTKSLTNNIIVKTIHQLRRKCYKCYFAKSYDQLPNDDICDLNPDVISYYSGPDLGICDVSLVPYRKTAKTQPQSAQTNSSVSTNDTSQPNDTNKTQTTNEASQTIQPNQQQSQLNSQQSVQANGAPATTSKPINNNSNRTPDNTNLNRNLSERNLASECWDSFAKLNLNKWTVYHHKSYGIACSLYENNPVTSTTVGDPIADVYAILTRKNNSLLILADGVNWGPRSRLAARCAVRAAMNHLNRNLFLSNNINNNNNNNNNPSKFFRTHDIFKIMMRSFDAAQEFILQKKGTMTTLCCSVVVKLRDNISSANSLTSSNSSLWAVLTLSIGDSTAYVFNREKGVFELTYGARNLNDDRDMRNVGGALGHVYGNKPDVSNLNYSLMYVKENDIVFLVSDGVSDNLDPIVSQTARRKQNDSDIIANKPATNSNNPKSQTRTGAKLNRSASQSHKNLNKNHNLTQSEAVKKAQLSCDDQAINLSSLPQMSPYERYVCSLAHMNEILLRNKTLNDTISGQEVCAILIEHVLKLTANKREILEKGLVDAANLTAEDDKLKFQAQLRERVQKLRGKLDHASIVAYEVGII